MSDTQRHESRADEIAAYLLGALEDDERAHLEAHLEDCSACQAELRWLRPAVRLLPESVERVEPPPELRERIVAEAEEDARRLRQAGMATASRRRLFSGWRPLAGLATLALVAAITGYAIGGSSGGGGGEPRSTTYAAGKAPGVTAQMVSSGRSATLHLANVHNLPDERVLEAWVQRGSKVTPVKALFVPDRRGRATETIPDIRGADAVMVTAEPRGGSTSPTSPPMVTLEMPQ